jgi:hypothetical protein
MASPCREASDASPCIAVVPSSNVNCGRTGTSVIVGRGPVDEAVDPRLAVEVRLDRLAVDFLLDILEIKDGTEPKIVL